MEITINGKKTLLPAPCSIESLLKEKNIPLETTVVELNGNIISDLSQNLKPGDILELIRMVGGG